ncbi:sensor histidine kinase [Microbacterium esteraromaticum]|nr:histidine kinase [Microbacterium esteraromaticum]
MRRRRLWIAVQDAVLALAVVALGLAELRVPFASVNGDGDPVLSAIGVILVGLLLAVRRRWVPASIGVFLIWLAIGIVSLGAMHALFFGQVLPFMIALYSLARHGQGRTPWIGAGVAAVTLIFGDIFIDALHGIEQLIFHWTVFAIAFVIGWGLRASEHRAVTAAVRLNALEQESREETTAAVAAERSRIARELHDILAHSVSVMVVQAGAAEQVVEDDPVFVRRALQSIRATGTTSLEEVRRVVAMLRDPDDDVSTDPQPGIHGLQGLVDASANEHLRTRLDLAGEITAVPAGLSLAVYRIVQESLTNVRKHSAATRADVRVRITAEGIEVDVTDNGTRTARSDRVGHGLIGMQERTALYGGTLIAGRMDSGYRVSARLPTSVVSHDHR